MTDSAISAAVIPSRADASDDEHEYGNLALYNEVPTAQDTASLVHSLTTPNSDFVRFPGFHSTRHPQQEQAGYHSSRSQLKPVARFRRWMQRSRSADSLGPTHDPRSNSRRDLAPPAPSSENPQMNRLSIRDQQSAACDQRAAARSKFRDTEPHQHRRTLYQTSDTRQGQETDDGTNLGLIPQPTENSPSQPERTKQEGPGELTDDQQGWFITPPIGDLPRLYPSASTSPDPGSPRRTAPEYSLTSQEGGDMATQSVTQSRHVDGTRPSANRNGTLVEPGWGLGQLLGDTGREMSGFNPHRAVAEDELDPRSRTRGNRLSEPHHHLLPRGNQAIRADPQDRSRNLHLTDTTYSSQGIRDTPQHPTGIELTSVGSEMFHHASNRDRSHLFSGTWYDPGEGWDPLSLDLVGNNLARDHRMTQRHNEVSRYHPTQQAEDWSSRVASIANGDPVSWTIDDTDIIRTALDTLLRGQQRQNEGGEGIETVFHMYNPKHHSTSSGRPNRWEQQGFRSQAGNNRSSVPPGRGENRAQGQPYSQTSGRQPQDLRTPTHPKTHQGINASRGSQLNQGAGATDPGAKGNLRRPKAPKTRTRIIPTLSHPSRDGGRAPRRRHRWWGKSWEYPAGR